MKTQRKPYVRAMTPSWWQKLGFYRFYMLREGTSVLAVWFSIVLLYGVFALKGGADNWANFVGFLQNPLVLLIHVVALLAAILHTKTWFDLAPKAANIVINSERMGPMSIVIGLWAVTLVVSVIILAVALM